MEWKILHKTESYLVDRTNNDKAENCKDAPDSEQLHDVDIMGLRDTESDLKYGLSMGSEPPASRGPPLPFRPTYNRSCRANCSYGNTRSGHVYPDVHFVQVSLGT